MRGKKGGRRRYGGGGREEEGKRGKEESQHLQPITLQHAAPGSISLTSRPHALPPVSVDERRCRALEVSASDWDLERYGVLTHYIPFSTRGCAREPSRVWIVVSRWS